MFLTFSWNKVLYIYTRFSSTHFQPIERTQRTFRGWRFSTRTKGLIVASLGQATNSDSMGRKAKRGKKERRETKKGEKRNNNKTRRMEYSQKENECRLQSIQLAGPRPKTVDASRLKRRPRSSWATTLSPCPQLVREHSTHPPVAFPPGVTVSSGREDYSSPLGWPSTGIVASLRGFVHSPPFEASHSRLRKLEKIRLRGLPRDGKRKSRFFWGSDSSRYDCSRLRAILKPDRDYFVPWDAKIGSYVIGNE